MSSTDSELEIQRLQRRVAREKLARKAAEDQLQIFSKEIYESNKALKLSVALAQKKQAELEFFTGTSETTNTESEITLLIKSSIKLTMKYLDASFGACVFFENGIEVSDPAPIKIYTEDVSVQLRNYKEWSFPHDVTSILQGWSVEELRGCDINGWLISSNFEANKGQVGWLFFYIESNLIDEEKLKGIDTTLGHLRMGVNRLCNSKKQLETESSLKAMSDDLLKVKQQLIDADRMATLGHLSAGIAHEINNPIAFIRSNHQHLQSNCSSLFDMVEQCSCLLSKYSVDNTEMLAELDYLKSDIAEILSENIGGLRRISDIASDLRKYANLSSSQSKKFDVREVFDSAIASSCDSSEKKLSNVVLPTQPLFMAGSADKIMIAIAHILSNAFEATKTTGKVSFLASRKNDILQVQIKDSGTGIDQKDMKSIFSPFFTTRPASKSTGMGLSLARAFIEAHGGQIKVKSSLGNGTTVEIELPLVSE